MEYNLANLKNLLVIICKSSGPQVDIKSELEAKLQSSALSYDFKKVKIPPEVTEVINKIGHKYQTVAVYGGDGSIVAAIKALADVNQNLLILPGGTANTISAELNLPSNAQDIMQMYIKGTYSVSNFDIAFANNKQFALDMHSGWWTQAITETPRELKKKFGAVAYGITAMRKLPKAEKQPYILEVRGKKIKLSSYTVLIANHGFQNFLGVRLFPHKHRSGFIQIAAINSISPLRLIVWLLGRSVSNINLGGSIKTYRAHETTILQAPKDFLFDDLKRKVILPLKITGGEQSTKIITLPSEENTYGTKIIPLLISLNIVRFSERLRSLLSGVPRFDYTRVTKNLYVGGTYRTKAYKQFKQWGITGVVNMRKTTPKNIPKGFEVLHLQTRDWTPPSLESLSKGVEFIDSKIKIGESVYVHCRQGEGRGPTMAAAYLISQGLSVEEAITQIKKNRPMANPNRSQVKRLGEWQELFNNNSK